MKNRYAFLFKNVPWPDSAHPDDFVGTYDGTISMRKDQTSVTAETLAEAHAKLSAFLGHPFEGLPFDAPRMCTSMPPYDGPFA
jgi:hypothetical protein